jgi:hypothetical protein
VNVVTYLFKKLVDTKGKESHDVESWETFSMAGGCRINPCPILKKFLELIPYQFGVRQ